MSYRQLKALFFRTGYHTMLVGARNDVHDYNVPYVFVTDSGVEDFFEQRTGITCERFSSSLECYFLMGLDGKHTPLTPVDIAHTQTGVSRQALDEVRQLKSSITDLVFLNVREYHHSL